MFMSTPDNAWRILTSDTKTDKSSYHISLPDYITYPTRHTDGVYNEDQNKLETFESWKDSEGQPGYDPDRAEKYPTLFDYWEQEVYVFPPVITGLDADYIIINLAVEKLPEANLFDLYTLRQKGGDETKAFWFLKIADLPVLDYYNPELMSYTDKFWDDTLFAKLIPLTPLLYVDPDNPESQSETFKPGYTAIYAKDIKFPADGDGPFQLVYVPPSFEMDAPGELTGPLIYKINKEYNPNQ